MYCGGSQSATCPICRQGWSQHAESCKYHDAATARLNAKEPKMTIKKAYSTWFRVRNPDRATSCVVRHSDPYGSLRKIEQHYGYDEICVGGVWLPLADDSTLSAVRSLLPRK